MNNLNERVKRNSLKYLS